VAQRRPGPLLVGAVAVALDLPAAGLEAGLAQVGDPVHAGGREGAGVDVDHLLDPPGAVVVAVGQGAQQAGRLGLGVGHRPRLLMTPLTVSAERRRPTISSSDRGLGRTISTPRRFTTTGSDRHTAW